MKYYKYIGGIIVVVIVALFVSQYSKPDKSIKIGYFAPATGAAAVSSEQMIKAFELAQKQSSELANGKKVELFVEDDACDPKQALTAAKKLVEVDKVDILVSGVCSGSTVAVAPYAEQGYCHKNKPIFMKIY